MPYLPTDQEEKMFEVFVGHLPTNAEMNSWPEKKFLSLIDFFKVFIADQKKEAWRINNAVVTDIYAKYGKSMENIYWREFLARLMKKPGQIPMAIVIRTRVATLCKVLGLFCRRNPSYITDAMREAVKGYKQLEFQLETFQTEKTKQGTEIITQLPDTMVGSPKGNIELIYQQATHRILHLYNDLAGSISAHDIKEMKAKDKIDSLSKLGYILGSITKSKNKSQIFIGLNVGKANRQELEDRLADYQQEQEKA